MAIIIHCSHNRLPPSFCCSWGRLLHHQWPILKISASSKHIQTVKKGNEICDFRHSIFGRRQAFWHGNSTSRILQRCSNVLVCQKSIADWFLIVQNVNKSIWNWFGCNFVPNKMLTKTKIPTEQRVATHLNGAWWRWIYASFVGDGNTKKGSVRMAGSVE